MNTVLDFLSMGGYAAYVWPALGVTAAVLIGLWVVTLRTLRARERQLTFLEKGEAETSADDDEA